MIEYAWTDSQNPEVRFYINEFAVFRDDRMKCSSVMVDHVLVNQVADG